MRGWLLDTNVVAALINPRGAPSVKAWAATQDEHSFHISALTLGEYDKGIHIYLRITRAGHATWRRETPWRSGSEAAFYPPATTWFGDGDGFPETSSERAVTRRP